MAALPPPEPPEQAIIVTGRALPGATSERVLHSESLTARDLRDTPSLQLDRLLDRFAGVQMFRRSDARSAHPTSQGITLRALGGNAASRVQLVLDGVPQSDPFGGWIAWPAFDASDLAEVRVARGGGSVVNGPGALGGTIELTSAGDDSLRAALDRGSRDSLEGHASARSHFGKGFVAASIQASRGDGFIPVAGGSRGPADRPAPYRNGSVRLRSVMSLGSSIELQTSLSGFADERERGLRYTADRSRGADASLRLVSNTQWAWTLLAYGQSRNFLSSFAAVDAARTEARRASLQYDVPSRSVGWSAELRPPVGSGMQLRVGADGRRMSGESHELASYSNGVAQRDRNSGGDAAYAGLFTELSGQRGPLLLSGSARVDRWSVGNGKLVERSTATEALITDAHYADRAGWRPTARAAAAFTVAPRLTLRGAAYLGWRLPTLNELFRPFRAGSDATAANPELRAERLRGAEAGMNWTSGPLFVELTAFANRLNDAIANVTLGSGPSTFPGVGFVGAGGAYRQRQNIEAIDVRGFEASARWRQGPWSGTFSSSLADAAVHASGSSAPLNGLRPAQTPRFAASASLGWERDRQSATIVLHYESARFEDDLNRERLRPALTIDASAAYPLSPNWSLVARTENLLNARIEASVLGNEAVERATPRTTWVGLRFTSRDRRN
jgi:outer membrane receptor protein involved in Fe transport